MSFDQLDLLTWQPPPEQMVEPAAEKFRSGECVYVGTQSGTVYHDDGGRFIWVSIGNTAKAYERAEVSTIPPEPEQVYAATTHDRSNHSEPESSVLAVANNAAGVLRQSASASAETTEAPLRQSDQCNPGGFSPTSENELSPALKWHQVRLRHYQRLQVKFIENSFYSANFTALAGVQDKLQPMRKHEITRLQRLIDEQEEAIRLLNQPYPQN